MTSEPDMTLLAITPDNLGTLAMLFQRLRAQTIAHRLELVIVAPRRDALDLDDAAVKPFHSWQVVEIGSLDSPPRARSAGVRAARAPFVAFTEDHSFPEPDWAERLLAAHGEGFDAVGPELENANPGSSLSWANLLSEYGQWMGRERDPDVEHLPGHNGSYRRELLMRYGDLLEEMLAAESVIHWDLRARGHRLCLEPAARTLHLNVSRWTTAISLRVRGGRVFASARSREWSAIRRLVYAILWPLIPAKRFRQVLADGRRIARRRPLPRNWKAVLAVVMAMDGFGEFLGYAFGPGDAVRRLSPLEFHRERYLSRNDREAFVSTWPPGPVGGEATSTAAVPG